MRNTINYRVKHLLFTLILFFCTISGIVAQSRIEGIVVDDSGKGISGVTVSLLMADSLVAIITTDDAGAFVLQPYPGKYTLVANCMGYKSHKYEFTLLNTSLKLPLIKLKESPIQLNEVVVLGERQVEFTSNSTIFRIPMKVKNTSSDIYSVLASIAPLRVNQFDQSVDIMGANKSIIMVNNIRRDKSYLMSIKPEDIEKVEVIFNPGMKYTIDNIDGIVNVYTRKVTAGYHGYINGRQDVMLAFGSQGGGFAYITPKSSFSINASNSYFDENNKYSSMIRETGFGQDAIIFERITDSKKGTLRTTTPNVGAVFDFQASKNSYTSLNLNYNNSSVKNSTPFDCSKIFSNGNQYDFYSIKQNQ